MSEVTRKIKEQTSAWYFYSHILNDKEMSQFNKKNITSHETEGGSVEMCLCPK